jgi:hypothetical protein
VVYLAFESLVISFFFRFRRRFNMSLSILLQFYTHCGNRHCDSNLKSVMAQMNTNYYCLETKFEKQKQKTSNEFANNNQQKRGNKNLTNYTAIKSMGQELTKLFKIVGKTFRRRPVFFFLFHSDLFCCEWILIPLSWILVLQSSIISR